MITRSPDATEPHEAVTPAGFAGLRRRGLHATWWQAHGLDYGVRRSELQPLADDRWGVLNGSRAHLPLLRAQAPGLRDARLARAIAAPVQADLHLVNDGDLRHAVAALAAWWRGLHDAG